MGRLWGGGGGGRGWITRGRRKEKRGRAPRENVFPFCHFFCLSFSFSFSFLFFWQFGRELHGFTEGTGQGHVKEGSPAVGVVRQNK